MHNLGKSAIAREKSTLTVFNYSLVGGIFPTLTQEIRGPDPKRRHQTAHWMHPSGFLGILKGSALRQCAKLDNYWTGLSKGTSVTLNFSAAEQLSKPREWYRDDVFRIAHNSRKAWQNSQICILRCSEGRKYPSGREKFIRD